MTLRLLGGNPRTGGAVVGLRTTIVDSFLADDARFFGELGLPGSQPQWTDLSTGAASITLVQENVFGVTKQVVRHVDNTDGGSTTTSRPLSVQDWLDIQEFGAVYGGRTRLDSVNGERGFFTGLQADAAENPTGATNRRFGLLFEESVTGGFLKVTQADFTSTTIDFDGTLGNPRVRFDEWFDWDIVIPAGLSAGSSGELWIQGIQTTFIPIFLINGGGLGSFAMIASGSTTGFDRVVLHDNFGVTIYQESATKTLSVAAMQADTAQMIIPPGRRDYTIIVPDGNPRKIGSRILLTKRNVGGTITLKAFDTANPEAVFGPAKLAQITKQTTDAQDVTLVNSIDQANTYDFGIAPVAPDKFTPAVVSTEDVTVVNTVAETTLLGQGNGTRTIPANSTKVGDRFSFSIQGIISSTGNPTLRLQLKSGAVILADTGAKSIGNLTNGHWIISGEVVTRSLGVTGTVTISGSFVTSAGDHFEFVNVVPVTLDSTINRNVDVTAIWGTAAAANTITAQIASLTKILTPKG